MSEPYLPVTVMALSEELQHTRAVLKELTEAMQSVSAVRKLSALKAALDLLGTEPVTGEPR